LTVTYKFLSTTVTYQMPTMEIPAMNGISHCYLVAHLPFVSEDALPR
jgi:hypothetical protein